ncbi:uncharacterized protein NPIL_244841 [Nephila pilipes]|uniref:Uncharacterized protein n=1 Tax=Nephila pilipes TaxID=299642 RepID=A0A8X6P444_NEPPI|nr:uncharacterized protein NPIL_244841 [Nephila pilipes]
MFLAVKSCKKELIFVAKEIGETVPTIAKISNVKAIILNSDGYKGDPEFLKGILENAVSDSKFLEEKELELLKIKLSKKHKEEFKGRTSKTEKRT